MKTESIIIRNQPKLQLLFNKKNFEIINDADKNDNGIYSYELSNSAELKTKKINWLVTSLSVFVEFFIADTSFGDVYREKNKLTFNYNKKMKTILLTDCDMAKAKKAIQILNTKLK